MTDAEWLKAWNRWAQMTDRARGLFFRLQMRKQAHEPLPF